MDGIKQYYKVTLYADKFRASEVIDNLRERGIRPVYYSEVTHFPSPERKSELYKGLTYVPDSKPMARLEVIVDETTVNAPAFEKLFRGAADESESGGAYYKTKLEEVYIANTKVRIAKAKVKNAHDLIAQIRRAVAAKRAQQS